MLSRACRALLVLPLLLLLLPVARSAGADAGQTPTRHLVDLSDSLRNVAERVGPTIVEVLTSGFVPSEAGTLSPLARQRGSGSGVLVSSDGYVVTNAHVVRGARRIQVLLSGRDPERGASILPPPGELVDASIVGTDSETDLAVLKVEAGTLPHLAFGDSDDLRQGELVLAFGSPLGLEHSVTLGVVSSVARQLSPEAPMIYIQTDAPINPGSSGGPLVDSHGRLVGINTLIFSQSGGNEGIGFAAPSNIVRRVYEQLRASGRVQRGMIGVHTQTITPALAKALDLPVFHGVLVRDVVADSPAAAAGVSIGDVVLRLDGKPMENARQFRVNVYQRLVGGQVLLEVLRGGAPLSMAVRVAERPGDPASIAGLVSPERNLVRRLGILAIDLDERILERMPQLRARAGVIVAAGAAGASQWEDSLRPGDVVYTINGESVTSVERLRERLRGFEPGEAIAVQVERDGELRYVVVELGPASGRSESPSRR